MNAHFALRMLILLLAIGLAAVPAESRLYTDVVRLGEASLQSQEYRRAIPAFTLAHRLQPGAALPLARLAEVYVRLGKPGRVLELCAKLMQADQANATVLSACGWAYAELAESDRASALWSAASKLDPDECDAHYRPGLYWLRQGQIDRAGEQFRQLKANRCPAGVWQESRYWLGVITASYEPEEAWTYLREAERGPNAAIVDSARTFRLALEKPVPAGSSRKAAIGAALFGLKQYALARESLERALVEHPTDLDAQLYLGATLDQLGQHEMAEKYLRLVIEHDPDNALAFYFWGRHLSSIGQRGAAWFAFERVLAIDPANSAACIELANLEWVAHRYKEAESWLEKATRWEPDRAEFYLALAGFEAQTTFNVSKGLAAVKKALEIDPQNARGYDLWGWLSYLSGEWDQAETALLRANELDRSLVEACYHLGRLYEAQGKIDLAKAAYLRVLDLAPISPAASAAQDSLERMGVNPDPVLLEHLAGF